MLNEVLFCEGCEDFFETTEDMASSHRQMRSDTDTCHVPILCDDCTLKAMIAEDEDSGELLSVWRCASA